MIRTHTCGQLDKTHLGEKVVLAGWVHARRDHGELIFIDLRDAYGICQLVFDSQVDKSLHEKAHELKSEYVIRVEGSVRKRPDGTENPKISTGAIEIVVNNFDILNTSITPPFEIEDDANISDEIRLKYRYLDLRRPKMQRSIRLRHRICHIMRNFLEKEGFIEIETPFLTRSTPEGARDFLVPSRLNPGKFYALPQSPQLFKQLLMVSGFDRYFQIVKCFRDEDLRKDRQPEFTQLDIEMSFIDEDDIFNISELMMKHIFKNLIGKDLEIPFPRIGYNEAYKRFGTDKPDTRFDMELVDLTELLSDTNFNRFKKKLKEGAGIYAINVKKSSGFFSRKDIDALVDKAKGLGSEGLAYFRNENGRLTSPIEKYFSSKELEEIKMKMKADPGDLILMVADRKEIIFNVLSDMRCDIARKRGLIGGDKFNFLWVVDFPLFKYNQDEKRWDSEHHPFTAFRDEDAHFLESGEFDRLRARSYDLVVNGIEIGSGSIRIHKREVQEKVLKILGFTAEETRRRFGFLLEAFRYGAPPHGGIAFGLDRFITLFTGSETIRDVIAFPKTQKAICPLTEAPSEVDIKQLRELGIEGGR